MGHLMRRPPKYTHGFVDRHGKARFYLRRPGFKRVPLPGLPWSPEFMAAYELAMAGKTVDKAEPGAGRTMPGSISALVVSYYNSSPYRSLAPSTATTYRNILERFRAEHGEKPVALIQRRHIDRLISDKAATPSAAGNLLKLLRLLMRHAVTIGMRDDDPTIGVKGAKVKTTGFHTWTEEEVAYFEARHAIGTRARLAFALLLYTAQRRSDVVKMGRQHIASGVLRCRQQKTGTVVEIPVHPELREAIDATPSAHLTFLVTEAGKPFTAAGFGNWFRTVCDEAGLRQCSAHGLRKAASRRLAEAGCTAPEIMSITGHKTLKEVSVYIEAVDRKRLAKSGMAKTSATSSGKPE